LNKFNAIVSKKPRAQEVPGWPCLIKAQADDKGNWSNSELTNPGETLNTVLILFENSIIYEVSGSTILEIEPKTDSHTITKEIETVQCVSESVQFLKLTGCYSCTSGANLFIHGLTEGSSTTATLECPTIGIFSPLHITHKHITRHLQYVQNVRRIETMVIHEPALETFAGFSVYGSNMTVWAKR
jgi:hypothetical protein